MRSLFLVALFALSGPGLAQSLTVFAASSLTEAFEDLAALFETRHPGVDVALYLAGSSTLSTQIVQGAPADLFASADRTQLEVVDAAGMIAGEPTDFARNRLVVITPTESPVATLADLATEGVLLVLAGPEVPVGRYARQALTALDARFGAGFAERVLANLVSEETNVRQAAAKVELGEADAAIVYATDAALLSGIRTLELPEEADVSARYGIAVLRDGRQPELARAFVELVLSTEGRRILERRGFGSAE